jgi:ABC-type dipeptide/oligopeptide/nickel transport system permease component
LGIIAAASARSDAETVQLTGTQRRFTVHLSFSVRLLLVLTAALMAVIVGLLAGVLAHLEEMRAPSCIVRGAAACGIALTLFVLVLSSLGALS